MAKPTLEDMRIVEARARMHNCMAPNGLLISYNAYNGEITQRMYIGGGRTKVTSIGWAQGLSDIPVVVTCTDVCIIVTYGVAPTYARYFDYKI